MLLGADIIEIRAKLDLVSSPRVGEGWRGAPG